VVSASTLAFRSSSAVSGKGPVWRRYLLLRSASIPGPHSSGSSGPSRSVAARAVDNALSVISMSSTAVFSNSSITILPLDIRYSWDCWNIAVWRVWNEGLRETVKRRRDRVTYHSVLCFLVYRASVSRVRDVAVDYYSRVDYLGHIYQIRIQYENE